MRKKNKRMLIIFLVIAFCLIILFSIISIYHAYRFTHPKLYNNEFRPKSMNLPLNQLVLVTFKGVSPLKEDIILTPADYNIPYQNVSFKSVDNLTIKGWLIKPANPKGIIILTHGWDSTKNGLLNYSRFIYKNGYAALMFDFRGVGESEGNYTSLGYYEIYDVLGAINYLKERPDTKHLNIGALGVSMGAATLVMATAKTEEIKALVIDSSYPSIHQNAARRFKIVYGFPKFPFATSLVFFGGLIHGFNGFDLAPIKYIDKANIPILIISGDEDEQVTIEDAMGLYIKAKDPKLIWIVEGAGHSNSYYKKPEEYEIKVVSFFNQYIRT